MAFDSTRLTARATSLSTASVILAPTTLSMACLGVMHAYLIEKGYTHLHHSNPTGRTGFAGRGLLDYWGPNHCVDPVITRCGARLKLLDALISHCRWARHNQSGEIKSRDGKNVLEVLLYVHQDTNKAFLPSNFVEPSEPIPFGLGQELAAAVTKLQVR